MKTRHALLSLFLLSTVPLLAQEAPLAATPEEVRVADDLVRRAREATGPRRSDESAAPCDARNREAMALLWDARWIRRAEADFSVEADLEAARRHVSGPIFGDARFRSPDPLTSAIVWRSAKGPRLVTGTETGRIAVWDAAKGEPLAGGGEPAESAVASLAASDRFLVAARKDGEVFAVDAESGRELWRYRPAKRFSPSAMAIRPGSKGEVVILHYDGLLRLEAATGVEVGTTPLAELKVLDGAFSADGSAFVAYDDKGTARVFRVGEGAEGVLSIPIESIDMNARFEILTEPHRTRRATISPSGHRVAVTRPEGGLAVFDVESSKELASVAGRPGESMGLAFGDEDHLAFRSGGKASILDLGEGKVVSEFDLPLQVEWTVLVPGAGLYAGERGEWSVLDAATGARLRGATEGTPAPVVHLVRRGEWLLATGGWTSLGYRGGVLGRSTALLDSAGRTVTRTWADLVVFDVDAAGDRAAGIAGNEYRVISLVKDEVLFRHEFQSAGQDARSMAAPAAALTPDGKEVFVSLIEGGCARFEVETGRLVAKLGAGDPPSPIAGLVLGPRSRFLAAKTVIDHLGQTLLFDLEKGKVFGLGPKMNMEGRTSFAFSPDGRWIASAQAGPHVLDLGDAREPRLVGRGLPSEVREDRGPESIVALAYSPDGKYLATVDQASRGPWDLGVRDSLVRVFEVGSWKLAARYDVGPRATGLCWDPDGRNAWIGHADGTISELLLVR